MGNVISTFTGRKNQLRASAYAVRARARRDEAERVADRAARQAENRCDCGLLAVCGERCEACQVAHRKAVKNAFGGL